MHSHTSETKANLSKGDVSAWTNAVAGVALVVALVCPTLAMGADDTQGGLSLTLSDPMPADVAEEAASGLSFTTPLDGPIPMGAFGLGAAAAESALPCLGPDAGARLSLGGCLGLGGTSDDMPPAVGFGVHYGVSGWLRLDAGVGVQSFSGDSGLSGDGLRWSQPGDAASIGAATGQRLGGGMAALVDVGALTGLRLGGMRPFLGAGLAVGRTHASMGVDGPDGRGLMLGEATVSGMNWGATVGSNYAVGEGINLDFAYRYAGQETSGSPVSGLGVGAAINGAGAPDRRGGDGSNHGMSIGLRLSF